MDVYRAAYPPGSLADSMELETPAFSAIGHRLAGLQNFLLAG